jgi:hypothetical protein
MSLLTLIQGTSKLIGLPSPQVVVASADTRILELLSIANSVGDELARDYQWQELTKTALWSATGSIDQGSLLGSIATDFGYFINQTFWDRDLRQQILGPTTSQQWQADLSFAVVSPPYRFIMESGRLLIGPTALTAGHTLVFNYVTKNWCQSSTGTPQSAFAADTDTTLIPEELFKLTLIWRWKSAKGLAYAEDMQTAEKQIQTYTGQNKGNDVLYLGGSPVVYFSENVPLGNWPQAP